MLLPGLTFDRGSGRPIVDRPAQGVCAIAIDPPAHGAGAGPPCDLQDFAAQVHRLPGSLEVADPMIVGQSVS